MRNASKTAPVKALAFYVAKKGARMEDLAVPAEVRTSGPSERLQRSFPRNTCPCLIPTLAPSFGDNLECR